MHVRGCALKRVCQDECLIQTWLSCSFYQLFHAYVQQKRDTVYLSMQNRRSVSVMSHWFNVKHLVISSEVTPLEELHSNNNRSE